VELKEIVNILILKIRFWEYKKLYVKNVQEKVSEIIIAVTINII